MVVNFFSGKTLLILINCIFLILNTHLIIYCIFFQLFFFLCSQKFDLFISHGKKIVNKKFPWSWRLRLRFVGVFLCINFTYIYFINERQLLLKKKRKLCVHTNFLACLMLFQLALLACYALLAYFASSVMLCQPPLIVCLHLHKKNTVVAHFYLHSVGIGPML